MIENIKVGQKFLSSGKSGVIVTTELSDTKFPVGWISDDGTEFKTFTDCGLFFPSKTSIDDLQPIPATIEEGVEFSGEQYRAEFERLVDEGRKFEIEIPNTSRWMPSSAFEPTHTYRLLPQHRDANGNVLKVGNRVEFLGQRTTIAKFELDRMVDVDGISMPTAECRLLTKRTRPLCAADLEKAPHPMFIDLCDPGKMRISPHWNESGVFLYSTDSPSWDELAKSNYKWRPSADQPWGPCEVTEEVPV